VLDQLDREGAKRLDFRSRGVFRYDDGRLTAEAGRSPRDAEAVVSALAVTAR
jgi:hypothetical protein